MWDLVHTIRYLDDPVVRKYALDWPSVYTPDPKPSGTGRLQRTGKHDGGAVLRKRYVYSGEYQTVVDSMYRSPTRTHPFVRRSRIRSPGGTTTELHLWVAGTDGECEGQEQSMMGGRTYGMVVRMPDPILESTRLLKTTR